MVLVVLGFSGLRLGFAWLDLVVVIWRFVFGSLCGQYTSWLGFGVCGGGLWWWLCLGFRVCGWGLLDNFLGLVLGFTAVFGGCFAWGVRWFSDFLGFVDGIIYLAGFRVCGGCGGCGCFRVFGFRVWVLCRFV